MIIKNETERQPTSPHQDQHIFIFKINKILTGVVKPERRCFTKNNKKRKFYQAKYQHNCCIQVELGTKENWYF